jgi:hypothetical protein
VLRVNQSFYFAQFCTTAAIIFFVTSISISIDHPLRRTLQQLNNRQQKERVIFPVAI